MVASGGKVDVPHSNLLSNEVFWAEKYEFLKRKGYQLRPRYEPGAKYALTSGEPTLAISDPNVMDAVRLHDGKKVFLKYMSPTETKRTRALATTDLDVPKNHVAPVFDLIAVGEEGYRIAVMPFLREFDDPQFQNTGEVLEAFKQFLEGIEHIHSKNIAHRDACWGNMMMDGSEVVPNGWHFVRPWSEDGTKPITFVPRSSVSVKYYFIDFGLSVTVDPSNPTATGAVGQDQTVPEFQKPDEAYNPLKLDIYQLGNTFKTHLVEVYNDLDFLQPLISAMTDPEPGKRPTASEASELLESIKKDVDPSKPVTLKPGVRVYGSDPPMAQSESEKAIPETSFSLKSWFMSKIKRIFHFRFKGPRRT